MFGISRAKKELREELAALEQRLLSRIDAAESQARTVATSVDARVTEVLGRFERDPDARVRFLLQSIAAEVRAALEQALADARQVGALRAELESAVACSRGGEAQAARFRAKLNAVHQAKATGYVSIFFTGGYTDRVRLLVGTESPPTSSVSELNCRNDINSYAGGVVRRGEYWVAESEKGEESGVHCMFTPFLA